VVLSAGADAGNYYIMDRYGGKVKGRFFFAVGHGNGNTQGGALPGNPVIHLALIRRRDDKKGPHVFGAISGTKSAAFNGERVLPWGIFGGDFFQFPTGLLRNDVHLTIEL
jgi:hypothetical protein